MAETEDEFLARMREAFRWQWGDNPDLARLLELAELVPTLRAELERKDAALRPFAEALQGYWSLQPDSLLINTQWGAKNPDLRMRITVGDFRRARAALSPAQKEGEA